MKMILYVHDQQAGSTAVASCLEMAGYRVEFVPSGEQCLQFIARELPSLVLMDILIEGKNGFEVCRAIRKKVPQDQLPIILASSVYRSRLYREEALQAGAQLYVLKPVRPDELMQMVHELLDAKACLLSAHESQHEQHADIHRPSRESS